jgi:hypothetical protein
MEMKTQSSSSEYLEAYERAMKDVVSSCGPASANKMLKEIEDVYMRTDASLKRLRTDAPEYETQKNILLGKAREEVHSVVEKYAPNTSDHIKELILGTSLAISATLLPVAAAASALLTATSIIAIGSSYYIGFKILKNWKAISGKNTLAGLAGKVPSKSVKSIKIGRITKKK